MVSITVHADRTVRSYTTRPIGINLNHYMDGSVLPPPRISVDDALAGMGVAYLRFPGGEKSDTYLWSIPPFEEPNPHFARWGGEEVPEAFRRFLDKGGDSGAMTEAVLRFDAFLDICGRVGAEPVVVLPYDSIYKPAGPGGHTPTRSRLLQTAEAWARYAVRSSEERGLPRVRFWELGNESYMKAYNGWATAADYAADIADWSAAMKAVDPNCLIGANGPNGMHKPGAADDPTAAPWWETVLGRSAGHIDFLAIHDYPCWKWGGYGRYLETAPSFQVAIDQAVESLDAYCSAEDARRIRILITEMSSVDWDGHPENLGWPHINTLGHALVLVDMLGQYLSHDRLDATVLWNTRWVCNDSADPPQLWDALRSDGSYNATGMAMALWAAADGDAVCAVDAPEELPAFAVRRSDALSLVVVNKGAEPIELSVAIEGVSTPGGAAADRLGRGLMLTGSGPEDTGPRLESFAAPSAGGRLRLSMPSWSAARVEVVTTGSARDTGLPDSRVVAYAPVLPRCGNAGG